MADDKLTAACKGCCYAGCEYCNYEVHTGHFRPCPPGNRCEFRPSAPEPSEYAMRILKSNPDSTYRKRLTPAQKDALFTPLYLQGLSDNEIGRRTGWTDQTVMAWRHQKAYPANKPTAKPCRRKGKKNE